MEQGIGSTPEVLGEVRAYLVPHHVCLWVAVQQEQRRAAPRVANPNRRLTGLDERCRESVKHHASSLDLLLGRAARPGSADAVTEKTSNG